ncbi:MAG: citrate synthase [Candidatus Thermoplasmatota archaeon]|jgi:citrate synthase|uniref:citrate synthase n=1 Tax=Ferroplasma sp. TaxID=2591003 RepID=UPI002612FFBD|nr:citrate synthase [Ferroplasma sp.]MCL4311333.1 citrate synthase [Candidatus Thermoplasmatota archaeon]
MAVSLGLEDVFIKYTGLTYIDGNAGVLRYRGYDVNDLVQNSPFEEVCYLMINGELPNGQQLEEFKKSIKEHYKLPDHVTELISDLPREADTLTMMETAFASLSSGDYQWNKENDRKQVPKILGENLGIISNIYRHKMGMALQNPDTKYDYAEAFLRNCFGKADDKKISAMNAALVIYVDHEVPASTTAALVASSTLSDMYSCITAATAALKGPLHGGAAEAAYKQLLDIGSVDNVDNWFKTNIVDGKRRLMGFGHRVYRTYDPRMKIFKKLATTLDQTAEQKRLFEIAVKLEELGVKEFGAKGIYPNTDYYSGIVFNEIGFPIYMFTTLFGFSRVLGWLAHVTEYVEEEERLIRPRAVYTGPDRRDFVKMKERN